MPQRLPAADSHPDSSFTRRLSHPAAAFLLSGCAVLASISAGTSGECSAAPRRPNVIFFLTDDQGWGDAAAWGHPYEKTPNLDRLTREGTRFSQFYVANPVCSPSRAAFMTGRYPARFRIHGHFSTHEQNVARVMPDWLDPQVVTLTSHFKAAGYATAHFGKWHLGHNDGAPEPGEYGIDEHITLVSNGPPLMPKGVKLEPHWWGKSTGIIMDHAIDFIRRHKDQPFYLNIWTLVPHATLDPTPEQLAVYADLIPRADHPAFGRWAQEYFKQARDLRSQMQVFAAAITDLDTQLGRLFDALKELGLEENTILVMSSDNGPEDYHVSNAANAGVGSPGPFRARKRSLYDGGLRTPFVIRWPGKIQAGRQDDASLIGSVDLLPTLCSLTGVKPPTNVAFDGEDVSDIVLSGKSRERKGPLYWEWRSAVAGNQEYLPPPIAVREGQWKLLTNRDRSRVELYDIPRDPGEEHNVAAEHPELVARLSKLTLDWKETLPPGEETPIRPKAKPAGKTAGKPSQDRFAMFKAKDSDHDGRLSQEEYLKNFPDPEDGRRRFQRFDVNHDGYLSEEEFVTMGGALPMPHERTK